MAGAQCGNDGIGSRGGVAGVEHTGSVAGVHQAVAVADHTDRCSCCVQHRGGPPISVEMRAAQQIVAGAQAFEQGGVVVLAHPVAGLRTDQAVAGIYHAGGQSGAGIQPGQRTSCRCVASLCQPVGAAQRKAATTEVEEHAGAGSAVEDVGSRHAGIGHEVGAQSDHVAGLAADQAVADTHSAQQVTADRVEQGHCALVAAPMWRQQGAKVAATQLY